MFYVDQATQKRYRIGTPFDYNERQYTKAGATHDKFIELGFTQVIPQQRPDSRFYIVSGPNNAGEYSSTPRDLKQTQNSFAQQELQAAQQTLLSSDFLYARATEHSAKGVKDDPVVVPMAVVTQRDDVRHTCKENCALIEATKDIEELEALIKAPAEVVKDPKAEEPVMIPNPDPHLNSLPSIDMAEYLTLKTL